MNKKVTYSRGLIRGINNLQTIYYIKNKQILQALYMYRPKGVKIYDTITEAYNALHAK